MDQNYLLKLLDLLNEQNGGVVLQQDGTSKAVLLSIDRYYELLAQRAIETIPRKPPETVLVTGGAGYIGGHVVRKLNTTGYEVIVVDNLSTGLRGNVPEGVTFFEGSIGDEEFLIQIFDQHKIDAVVHLAASISAPESIQKPLEYLQNNVLYTEKLLNLSIAHQVKKFIFSSTAAVYGNPQQVPTPESALISPLNPYGMSKYLSEEIIRFYSQSFGIESTVLRSFNACGIANDSGLKDTHLLNHPIPIMLEAAYGKRESFTVLGNDHDTFDGTCIRDYVHVEDIAEAMFLALQKNPNKEPFRVYNVGAGRGYSIEQMVTTIAEVFNRIVPLEIAPRRPGDPSNSVADISKIKAELGFEPKHSSLENILLTTKQLIV